MAFATSLTVPASATSTATTITAPADIQAGDVLLLLDKASDIDGGSPTAVVPTGFTNISTLNDTSVQTQICSYKIADGSEASSTITGMVGGNNVRKAMIVIRPDAPATAVNVGSLGAEISNANPAAKSVTASAGSPALIVIGAYGNAFAAISPRTFSTTADAEITPATNLYLAYKIYNSSPADTSIDMDDEGTSNALQGFYLEVTVADAPSGGKRVGAGLTQSALLRSRRLVN
jgi:hypothetical protein